MSLILSIDQSTSATKVLLFESDGRWVDKESLEHRQYYPQPGWVEHDAEEIWRNVVQSLRSLLVRQRTRASEIAGLSITNQRETIVIFERGTGRPLFPAIVWQCRRSESICAAHVAAGRGVLVRARTGLTIDAYFSGSKLQWLVQNRPELRKKLETGEALIGTMDAYLIYRLTRGTVFATDSTNASRTLLFDIGRLRWDAELCALWEVPLQALPEVRESFARFGETTLEGLVSNPLPICGVMGDSQAALFAHGCFEPGSAKVTFGTGSSVMLNVGSQLPVARNGIVTALAWVNQGVPVYAFEGIIISAASTLTWLRDQLQLVEHLEKVEAMATDVPDNGGVYLVPAFSGLGFPHWVPTARAALVGLSTHSDRRHVVRAALESIAYQLQDALQTMRDASSVPLRAVHCDGGPTSNRFLMQFTAEMTRAELRVSPMADCSALGAARAGALGLGLSSIEEFVAPHSESVIYRPQLALARIAQLEQGWRHAVAQTILPAS